MPVATLTLELAIEHAHSLKDRRQAVRSLKDKLRHGFNISVAELDEAMVWNRATVGVAAISSSAAYLAGQLREVEEAAAASPQDWGAKSSTASSNPTSSSTPDSRSSDFRFPAFAFRSAILALSMPEQRARQHHRDRVASTFSEEITAMLEGELTDPRIAPCYVTEVVLAPGGKSCRVFIAVHGGEKEEADTLAGLMAARGYIRTEIRDRMGVRHVPEITFAIDRSEKIGARMAELLTRAEKGRKKIARRVAAAEGETAPKQEPQS